MSQSQRMRALAGGLALVAGLAALGGCGDNGKVSVKSDDSQVSVDADKGGVSVQSDQGTVTAGKGLPDGFPTDQVPLLDATVVTSTHGVPGGRVAWSVVMQTSRAVDDVTAEVKKDFAAAGYTVGRAEEMGDVTILQLKGTSYDVSVTAARSGSGITVTYLVKTRS